MNELMIFENKEFGQVRTITEDGKTLFCGKDTTVALGYKDSTNAMKQHCRGVVKRHLTDSLGRKQETNFIPEGDIYRLAAKSELPGAERFESWFLMRFFLPSDKLGATHFPSHSQRHCALRLIWLNRTPRFCWNRQRKTR